MGGQRNASFISASRHHRRMQWRTRWWIRHNYDEDNASVADSNILQASKSQTPSHPASSRAAVLLAKEAALKHRFDTPYDTLESSFLDFYSDKRQLPDQLAVNRADDGIDTDSRSLIDQVNTYVSNSPTSLAKWLGNLIPYILLLYEVKSPWRTFWIIQIRIKRHRWYSKMLILLYSLWVGDESKYPNLFSWRPLHQHANAQYSPEHTQCRATFDGSSHSLPNTGFCAFNQYRQIHPGLGLLLLM